ncbi:lycopene cyclase family protein [Polaribacter gangjinensis]|uniref:Lycopene cyclase n=1 Tax=Polaribacter gangjinensis TaxID=574710 RepID=A0A2S7W9L2_9FLAO|nr:lycopene cyclase family protein [Polaribacter gangjinensis]PQJ74310.1 lycopene cyclase [Polaribacter gangjinensis]
MKNYDYIIVGAGASGLLMAYRMSKDSFFDNKQILIIDKEQKLSNDRTWCFWEKGTGEWDDILVTSWKKIQFKSFIHSLEEPIFPYQYKMIRSKEYYEKIWNHLATKTNITFFEDAVVSIHQEENGAKVVTATNSFYSETVINSILFSDEYKTQTKYPVLQQHFVGFFIKTEEDCFHDEMATFMDFTIAQKGNTRFMYVLPFSKNEALFEYTLFSEHLLPVSEYETAIEHYLKEKNITNYIITEKEQGSIPMTCYHFWKNNSPNIIHIGTAGGWSKASTGFTFKNTTKKTIQLVAYLKANKPLESFHKINKFWFYDLLLLDILHEKNYLGSTLFGQLFKKTTMEQILKFLDEETSLIEDLQILMKMPPANFIRAIFKRVF